MGISLSSRGMGISRRSAGPAAPTAPAAFTIFQWSLDDSPSAGGDKLNLIIDALPANGGAAITALEYRRNGGAPVALVGTGTGERQITVTATTLANIEIRAVNAIGNGPWSDVKSETPTAFTVPAQFGTSDWSVVDANTTGTVNVTLTALPGNGGSALTAIQYQVNAGAWTSLGGTTLGTYAIAGLTNGVSVNIGLRAVNAIGNGTGSATKAVIPTAATTVPSAFTIGQWTLADSPSAGGDTLSLNILALAPNGGSAITSLEYRRNGGSETTLIGTGTGVRSITVLAGAEAQIQIRALNANGAGEWSDVKSVTPTVVTITRAILEQQIIDAHEENADTNFQGWLTESGFTVYTETTPDAVRSRIETWRANPSNLIKIICDWDGILNLTTASLRGPANTVLVADAGSIDGYVRPSGGVWLQAAGGKSPVFGNQTITINGMSRIFFDGIGFAGQANAAGNKSTGDNIRQISLASSTTFPLYALAAFKNCTFGLTIHRPAEPSSEYIKAIQGSYAYTLHIENCEFAGVRDVIAGRAKYLRVWNNHARKVISDFITQFSFTASNWVGHRVYAWVEGNVLHDLVDEVGYDGLHTDFYQAGTSLDVHLGNDALVRYNIAHMKTKLSDDAGSQFFYSDDHVTAKNNFVIYENIAAVSAYSIAQIHDPSGEGHFFVEDNLGMRSGDYDQTAAQSHPRIIISDFASSAPTTNGGTISIQRNYFTSVINSGAFPYTSGGSFFVDPRDGVVSGTGLAEGSPKRPEDVFSGTFTRSGGDRLTYTIPNETSADKATAFYGMVDFFEPDAGWGVDAGPSNPETWPTAPERPPGFLEWPPAPFAVARDFGGTGSSTLEGVTSGTTPTWDYMNTTFLTGGTLYDKLDTVPASGGELVYNGGVGGSTSAQVLERVNGTSATVSYRFNNRMRAMDLIVQLGGAYGAGNSPEDAVRTDGASILSSIAHNRFVFAHKHYDAMAPHGNRDHTRINRLMRLDHAAHPGKVENVALMFNKFPPADGIDAAAQLLDKIPPSLQVDTAHPNTPGYRAIAERSYLPFKYAMEQGTGYIPHQELFFDAPSALNTSGVVVGTIPHHPETTITGSTFETNDPRFSAAVETGAVVLRRANSDLITNGYTDIALKHIQGGIARTVHQRVRIRDTTPSNARTYINSQFMVREKLPSNVVNGGKQFSFAILFRVVGGDATSRTIAYFPTATGVDIQLKSSNRFGCTVRNTANTANPVNLDSGTGANLITVASGWRAAFFCADTTTGVQIAKWVIDNNAATTNVPTADAALAIWPATATTQGRLFSRTDAGSSLCNMEIGALWMAEGYVEWTTSGNRDAFRNGTTMRSNLTGTGAIAGVTPFLWMQGPAGNWSSGLNLAAPGDFWDAGIGGQMTTV